jgi:hypothetical protein
MTIHSGGPHILLFERDQQLTALLMSELQLAGYECHAARTAVEVFDAIARFPVRLVLVNLAQAAAGRREFWVALDAQRRGRGVQVLTFRCMNIAGYGVDDPDERARIVLTDMEVDGMLGVMRLVDAVRARIPAAPSTSNTGSFARAGASPLTRDSARHEAVRPAVPPGFTAAPPPLSAQPAAQVTAPFPALNATPSGSMPAMPSAAPGTAMPPAAPPSPSSLSKAQPAVMTPPGGLEQPLPSRAGPGTHPSTFTDKIRAVIHPGHRDAWTQPPQPPQPSSQPSQEMPRVGDRVVPPVQAGEDSSLARLSRMVQETAATPPLRVSPIEDLPIEHQPEHRNGAAGTGVAAEEVQESVAPTQQLASVSSPPENRVAPSAAPVGALVPPTPPVEARQPDKVEETASRSMREEQDERINAVFVEQGQRRQQGVPERAGEAARTSTPAATEGLISALGRRSDHSVTSEDVLLNIVQSLPPMNALPTPAEPPAPPQPSVLSGRATRSLANVLLDGHLVPQDRLEVAQNIQRMLRGVDMNYQLGEILLMFKLLTPDQLLAASLVSYGMISAVQISALGRIRQELHSIGLEYDLESLLVLFRILTPDQLREVRSTWTG